MTDETPQGLIDALDRILDQERQALMQGALDQIDDLMREKEALIDKINAAEAIESASLANLQDKVARNQALLSSALEGIRAVANRMADLRRVRSGLETYDHRGRKKSFGIHPQSHVEKRA